MMMQTTDSAAPIGAIARLKLARELGDNKKQMDAVGDGPMAAMKRLKLAKRSNEIRAQLGAAKSVSEQSEADQSQSESPHVAMLRDLASGKFDGQGLEEMYDIIQKAVTSLNDESKLSGDAESVANEAITHWAEMEERING